MSIRIIAEFHPQVWMNDNAIPVNPCGETEWDATEHYKALYKQGRLSKRLGDLLAVHPCRDNEILDDDDAFRDDPEAPEWVRNWWGPFDIYLRIEVDNDPER